MHILEIIGLIGIVIIGGLLGIYVQKLNATVIPKIVLSFGGAYLLGLAFVELLPVVYEEHHSKVGAWVLVGFLIQLLLEQFSHGVEHGHMHEHHHHHSNYYLGIMVGLSVHAFLEGFPLQSGGIMAHHGHAHAYFWGIIIHKLPAAFALVSVLLTTHLRKRWIYICLICFSLMTPLGAWVATWLTLDESLQHITLAVVIGLFLHIATTILFEVEQTEAHHRLSWLKLAAILIGFLMVLIL